MPTFQVRSRKTRMILAEVEIDDKGELLEALAAKTWSTIEEVVASLGGDEEAALASLDLVPISPRAAEPRQAPAKRGRKAHYMPLPPRRYSA